MNNNFRDFIEKNKTLAISKGVNWDIPTAPDGTVKKKKVKDGRCFVWRAIPESLIGLRT
jgi:hypothetical protein